MTADPYAAFADAGSDAGSSAGSGGDPWAAFADAKPRKRAASSPAVPAPAAPRAAPRADDGLIHPLEDAEGVGELGLQGITSLLNLVPKGVAGVVGMLQNGRAGMKQTSKDIDAAPQIPFEPSTRGAVAVNRALGKTMAGLDAVAQDRSVNGPLPIQQRGSMAPPRAGAESTAGSDAAGATISLLPQAAAMLTPAKGIAKVADATIKAPVRYFSPEYQAGKVLRRAAGTTADRTAQVAALRSASQPDVMGADVPNSGPTAAQALSDIPEGTTLQALQNAVSRTPDKGVSPDFARRQAAQRALLDQAKTDREAATAPARDEALAAATATGGVEAAPLLAQLDGLDSSATVRGAPVAQRVTAATRKFIQDNTDAHGKIDPAALYQWRKVGLGQAISEAAGTDLNAATHAKVNVSRGVQDAIDQGMENAGATGWRGYLKDFSARSKPIDALADSLDEQYSPEHQTAIGDSAGMKDQIHAPNVLSTKMVVANYGLGLRRALMGKAVNRHVANALLDPSALADILDPATDAQKNTSQLFKQGPPAPPQEARFGPHLDLEPGPGRAFEPGYTPQAIRDNAPLSGVTQAESTQNTRPTLKLTLAKGRAFSSNQPSVLRSGEDIPKAESTNNPRDSLVLRPPTDDLAFDPHNEAVTSSRSTDGPRTAPQWELTLPKPHYSVTDDVAALIKKLREQKAQE